MFVVGWRSNQTFWCLPGLSIQTHQVSTGFSRAGGCFVGPTLPGISAGVQVTQQKLFSVDQSLPFVLKDYSESKTQVTERFMLELDPHGSEHE